MATIKDHIDLIKEIQELNPDVTIELGSRLEDVKNEQSFYCSVGMKDLKLPKDYRIDGKYITNNSAFISDPLFFTVNDINEVKDIKTNDISKVKGTGYTEEEEEYLRRKEKEAQKAIEEELNKGATGPTANTGATSNGGIDLSGDNSPTQKDNIVRKVVKNTKKVSCKVVGLFSRIKARLQYAFAGNAKVDIDEEERKAQERLAVNYSGQTLDDLTVISNLFKKIENDKYMVAMLKKLSGNSGLAEFANDPHKLVEVMKDVTLAGELHEFAIMDPKFDGAVFNQIVNAMIKLRREELYICNRILQQVRFGGVKENQMQFLIDRIKARGADFKFDTPKKDEPNKGGNPAGTPGGNPGGNNGGNPGGGDNPGGNNGGNNPDDKDNPTPEPVKLSEFDKKKADLARQYSQQKIYLLKDLGDYEKAFVEDATAEGLEPGDSEFLQMLNERAVNKKQIFNYYKNLLDIRQLMIMEIYDSLDEFEQAFVDESIAEGLVPGDNEFNMMLGERTVHRERVLYYLKEYAEFQKFKSNIINLEEFYKKNFTEQNVIESSGGRSK